MTSKHPESGMMAVIYDVRFDFSIFTGFGGLIQTIVLCYI